MRVQNKQMQSENSDAPSAADVLRGLALGGGPNIGDSNVRILILPTAARARRRAAATRPAPAQRDDSSDSDSDSDADQVYDAADDAGATGATTEDDNTKLKDMITKVIMAIALSLAVYVIQSKAMKNATRSLGAPITDYAAPKRIDHMIITISTVMVVLGIFLMWELPYLVSAHRKKAR